MLSGVREGPETNVLTVILPRVRSVCETERQAGRQTGRHTAGEAGRQAEPEAGHHAGRQAEPEAGHHAGDRKSTRLNSSHVAIAYAVFCLKQKSDRSGADEYAA